MRYYKEHVFDKIKQDVAHAVLTLVNLERDGTVIDRALVGQSVEVFETMGLGTMDVYVADFEALLLSSTR